MKRFLTILAVCLAAAACQQRKRHDERQHQAKKLFRIHSFVLSPQNAE
jgi:hypothetical protein